jgi:SAM-dependent methyltransferase
MAGGAGIQGERWLYDALYRTGLSRTMWDRDERDEVLARWVPRAEGGAPRAIDLGCGSGENSLLLARLGYAVDGVDFSPPAIARARERAARAGVSVRFYRADVLRFEGEPPYEVAVDYGCFHNLPPANRAEYAARVGGLVRAGGMFVLMALAPRFRGVDWRVLGPHHLAPEEIDGCFGGRFAIEAREEVPFYWRRAPAVYRPLSGPYRGMAYRMRRRA